MASNGMNGTKAFQDTIAQYLMKRAENDPLVAVKLANPSKTMEQCCAYIIGEVKKSGCCGFTDDEIFGMAMHYWEEPKIEVGNAPANCRVVVNHVVELTEEDKEQARQEAIAKLKANEEYDKFHERTQYQLSPVEIHFLEAFEAERKRLGGKKS